MNGKNIGVYICHCGGNISDYIDVGQLGRLMKDQEGIVISKNIIFACSDASQKEMIQDIREKQLDGFVVASCSPKLHTHTFRQVAVRAGINQYHYTQVNLREQCSWAHSDNPHLATIKAFGLIVAGINRVRHSESLENNVIKAFRAVAVIGAGVAGMRAAIDLAKLGNQVYLIEKESTPGGHVAQMGRLFPTGEEGGTIVEKLHGIMRATPSITLFANASVEKISGSVGNFTADIKIIRKKTDHREDTHDLLRLNVGAILVTTGFDFYEPKEGEYCYGKTNRVISLPTFNKLLDSNSGKLYYQGRQIRNVTFIYCVGNRQTKGENKYCSRQCCTAAIFSSIQLREKFGAIKAYHLYRDIRTYGKQELFYEKSARSGDVYMRFEEKEPPVVEDLDDKLMVKIKDYLTMKMEITFETDLVVLVTGMVARKDSLDISGKLKIPIGRDRFFNEIHPKLKPVETVSGGIFIAGACQGPKNICEAVQSSLSAAAKIHALIRTGTISIEPIVARVNLDTCAWCGKCSEVCEYEAISSVNLNGKLFAEVNAALCKGCGICSPVCQTDAIEIVKYTNNEIESMIDGFMSEMEIKQEGGSLLTDQTGGLKGGMMEYPETWNRILSVLDNQKMTIPSISEQLRIEKNVITYHIMTMNRYGIIEPSGTDTDQAYFFYKLKK